MDGIYYEDNDGDGFGSVEVEACDLRVGLSAIDGDCDDTRYEINPAATVCDEVNNSVMKTSMKTFKIPIMLTQIMMDLVMPSSTLMACNLSEGYVEDMTDCNDNDTLINPSMSEVL